MMSRSGSGCRGVVTVALIVSALLVAAGAACARPRIGLVLSGGGARGLAHIGVLKVLQQLRVPVDAIAGTSMGAIIGGAYAAGVPVDRMQQLITGLHWARLFRDNPPRQRLSNRRKQDERTNIMASIGLRDGHFVLPEGAISGQRLDSFVHQFVARADSIDNFDHLPIPFRAVATDLVTGKPVIFEHGSLATAMRASMSIPGVIAPLKANNRLLVDGGLVRNLPVAVARAMGVDVIIAVNLGTPLLKRSELTSALAVTAQMIAILTEQNVQRSLNRLHPRDILIQPRLGDISAIDFDRGQQAIERGEAAALAQRSRLRRLSLSPAAYARWRERFRAGGGTSQPLLAKIRIVGTHYTNPRVLRSYLQTRVGQPLDRRRLRADIQRLYGRGDFDRVTYRLSKDSQGGDDLTIQVNEKSWGPDYLRFGVGFDTDLHGNSDYGLVTSYLRTWVNPLGAAWQTDLLLGRTSSVRTAFYQPLDVTGRWFVEPYAAYQDRSETLFSDGKSVTDYRIQTARVGLDLGLNLHARGTLRIGPVLRHINAVATPSVAGLAETHATELGLRARYEYDQLDNLGFPGSGDQIQAGLWLTRQSWGAPTNYGRFDLRWTHAFGTPTDRWHTGLELGARLDGELPPYDSFRLGGFQRLSGLQNGELQGQYLGLAKLVYDHRVTRLGGAFGGDLFAGGSVEAGNVWSSRHAIGGNSLKLAASIFLGVDTFLGPFYLGYGHTTAGHNAVYLQLGPR